MSYGVLIIVLLSMKGGATNILSPVMCAIDYYSKHYKECGNSG